MVMRLLHGAHSVIALAEEKMDLFVAQEKDEEQKEKEGKEKQRATALGQLACCLCCLLFLSVGTHLSISFPTLFLFC